MTALLLPEFVFKYHTVNTTHVDDFLLTKRTKSELMRFYDDLSNDQEKFKFWARLNDFALTCEEKTQIGIHMAREISEMTGFAHKAPVNGWSESKAGISFEHYVDGELHSLNDLPASVWHNGNKTWYKNGETHRTCGPAETFEDKEGRWFYKGNQIYVFDRKPKINRDSGETWTICFLDQGTDNDNVSYHRTTAQVIKRIEGKIFEVKIFARKIKTILAGNPF